MTGIIFGIIIPLFLYGTSDVQNVIDSKGGIWIGGTGCENTKWIASHNRDAIGKNINNIKKGKEVKISQCKYVVEDILIVSKKSLWSDYLYRGTTLQTCYKNKLKLVRLKPNTK